MGEKDYKMKINKEEFKKDFYDDSITNCELMKKYKFDSYKKVIQFAKDNNLIIYKKHTEEEKKNLQLLSSFINKELQEL